VNQVLPAATQDNTTGDITPSVTVVTFVVPTAGAFLWYCTNPCGPGHMTMTGTLVVLPDD
jgi:heme/copper-type cytochrome/quinol oxidase subunit 2